MEVVYIPKVQAGRYQLIQKVSGADSTAAGLLRLLCFPEDAGTIMQQKG